jgi:predicted DNA-binding transcriptional regulator AlpA
MSKQSQNTGPAKLGYSINEYCAAVGISRGTLYNLWRRGEGPRRMKIGCRTIISTTAAADYHQKCEAEAEANA